MLLDILIGKLGDLGTEALGLERRDNARPRLSRKIDCQESNPAHPVGRERLVNYGMGQSRNHSIPARSNVYRPDVLVLCGQFL